MSWYTIFYLVSVASGLSTFFGWMCVIFTLIFGISLGIFVIAKISMAANGKTEDNDDKIAFTILRKWVWYSTPFFVFFWIVYVAIPTRKDMILIIAGGTVAEFVSNDSSAQKIPSELAGWLKTEIQVLKKEANEELTKTVSVPEEKTKRDSLMELSKEQLIQYIEGKK